MYKDKDYLKLYAVTDRACLKQDCYIDLYDAVEAALKGGVTCIQLREKDVPEEECFQEAMKIKKLTDQYNIPLIINDNVELAVRINADGVHLGQEDMDVKEARKLLGNDKIIGVSAHNVEEALAAQKDGADYLGSGSVFSTTTKQNVSSLSKKTLRDICHAVTIPVVAIGGVSAENLDQLTGLGVSGIAVVSAIFGQSDICRATKEIKKSTEAMLDKTKKFEDIYARLLPIIKDKKGLVFDMDGTLIDSMPMWRSLDVEYIGQYGIVPDTHFHHEVATMTLEQASVFIRDKFRIPKTPEEIYNDFQDMVLEQYEKYIPLKSLAYALVSILKQDGYSIAIATANDTHLSELVLQRTGLLACVDTMVSCSMAGESKESPAVYYLACEKMNLKPEECVVFEDSIRAIYTAKKAGFKTVAVYDTVAENCWDEICRITDEQVVLDL